MPLRGRAVNYRHAPVGRLVDVDDLLDAHGVAALLGLSHPNAVSTYRRRYHDFPDPVIDFGSGRCLLWHRDDVEGWRPRRGEGHD